MSVRESEGGLEFLDGIWLGPLEVRRYLQVGILIVATSSTCVIRIVVQTVIHVELAIDLQVV